MEPEFLDDAAPELSSWTKNRRGYLFEEQPGAQETTRPSLHTVDTDEVDTDEADDWFDSEDA
jgi:hypothetical protein